MILRFFSAALLFLSGTTVLYAQTLTFADGLTFNDFYGVTLSDAEGRVYNLFDVAYLEGRSMPWPDVKGDFGGLPGEGPEEQKYFFWVRRPAAEGVITYPLSFRKILRITFTGSFGRDSPAFTPTTLMLSDGTEYEVQIKTDGFIGGVEENFGTYALLWLAHDGIREIEFHHDGGYTRCPECGALFYDDRRILCPFDGTELVPSL